MAGTGGEADAGWYDGSLAPLAGGYSGETFVAGPPDQRVVVRVYARKPRRAAIDASLLRLVRGLIPVPEVLELRHPTDGAPGVLVTRYVEGRRLDLALADDPPALDGGAVQTLAEGLAAVLNTLAGIPFLRPALFADAQVTLSDEPIPTDLRQWADDRRATGRLAGWSAADWKRLTQLLDRAADLLDEAAAAHPTPAVLVHSDFNPKNILVDPRTWQVVAVLDWEFAYAGSPYADLGNFCRFERDPRLVQPLVESLTRHGDARPHRLLRLARAADLWALVELAGRPQPGPVSDLAADLLHAQAVSGDLEAWPWSDTRRDPLP